MDISANYILMCSKATEMQENYKEQDGDFINIKFKKTFKERKFRRYKQYTSIKIGDILQNGDECIDIDFEKQMIIVKSDITHKDLIYIISNESRVLGFSDKTFNYLYPSDGVNYFFRNRQYYMAATPRPIARDG